MFKKIHVLVGGKLAQELGVAILGTYLVDNVVDLAATSDTLYVSLKVYSSEIVKHFTSEHHF